MIAAWALVALLLLDLVPSKFVTSALFGGLIWVFLLGEYLIYVYRRSGRFKAFLAHRDRCAGCGKRLLHSMLHEGLSYQCGSCHVIQPWAALWDRQAAIRQFTGLYTDDVFKRITGKTREQYFARMDDRGAFKSHAAAVEAVPKRVHPYTRDALAICYEVDRGCARWRDLETPMFEPTLLGMAVRICVLIAIPAGLVAWRLLGS